VKSIILTLIYFSRSNRQKIAFLLSITLYGFRRRLTEMTNDVCQSASSINIDRDPISQTSSLASGISLIQGSSNMGNRSNEIQGGDAFFFRGRKPRPLPGSRSSVNLRPTCIFCDLALTVQVARLRKRRQLPTPPDCCSCQSRVAGRFEPVHSLGQQVSREFAIANAIKIAQ